MQPVKTKGEVGTDGRLRLDFPVQLPGGSSRTSIGGLRYLENGEFRLVRESLRERNRLLENAPHYVRPLATTIPTFSWAEGLFSAPARLFGFRVRPGDRGAVAVGTTIAGGPPRTQT